MAAPDDVEIRIAALRLALGLDERGRVTIGGPIVPTGVMAGPVQRPDMAPLDDPPVSVARVLANLVPAIPVIGRRRRRRV